MSISNSDAAEIIEKLRLLAKADMFNLESAIRTVGDHTENGYSTEFGDEVKIPFYAGTDDFLEKKRYMEKTEGMEYVRFEPTPRKRTPMDWGPLPNDGTMIFRSRKAIRAGAEE